MKHLDHDTPVWLHYKNEHSLPIGLMSYQLIAANVTKLTSENAFSRISCRLFTERQINFLPTFSPKFVISCAAKKLKIGLQIKKIMLKIILNREFAWAREMIQNF